MSLSFVAVAKTVNRLDPNAGISAVSVWNAGELRVNALNAPNAIELFTVASADVLGARLARPLATAIDAGIAFVMPMTASVPFCSVFRVKEFAEVHRSSLQN